MLLTLRPLMTSCALAALAISMPVFAQAEPDSESPMEEEIGQPIYRGSILGEIVVTADRLRDQVDAAQAPILELDEADIAAYGASSIADLVAALGPVTGSSRGRGGGQPVFLINGIRIGSFREFQSYPSEAIRKTEILPEEVAQKFGFPPDRRVINFILKDNYSALTGEIDNKQPSRGGFSRKDLEGSLLKIAKGARINVDLQATDRTILTEEERNVVQIDNGYPRVAGDPDQAAYRSLIGRQISAEASVNYAKAFVSSGSSISLNSTVGRTRTRSLSGLDTVLLTNGAGNSALRVFGAGNPLERRNETDSAAIAATYTRPIGTFQLTATADAGLTDSRSEIDRRANTDGMVAAALAGTLALDGALPSVADAGFDSSNTKTNSTGSKLTVRGTPLMLPGGELGTTFDLGFDWDRIEGQDTRTAFDTRLTRGNLNGGINLAIPLTSTREGFLDEVGSITLNLSGGFDRYSDFATLYDWSAGFVWSPVDKLDLSATYTNKKVPPSLAQLGNAQFVTLNVPVFDFRNGTTELVSILSGGNPSLIAETQRDWTFSANWELPFLDGATVQSSYTRNRSNNVSSAFPLLTSDIEAAFSDRVTRDASGRLLAIDQRPVTFDSINADRLAFGLSLRGSFGKAKVPERREGAGGPERNGRGAGGRPPGGAGGAARGGGGGGPGGFGGNDGRGRFFLNLNHTLELKSTVLIAPGGPVLNLLDGDSLSSGGVARNSTRLEGGMFRGGLGLRVSGTYAGPTRVDGSGLPGSTDLFFGDLAKVDVRLFANLGEVFGKKEGLLKGLRLSLRADNLFDGIQRVTDQNGNVPLSYQPALVDPVGRYIGLEIRKQI